jgi:dolichol kinase
MPINLIVVSVFLLLDLVSVLYYFRLHSAKRFLERTYPVVLSAITMIGIAVILNEVPGVPYFFMIGSFAVLLPLLPSYFVMNRWAFVGTLVLLVAEFVYAIHFSGEMLFPFIQAFAVGTLYGIPNAGSTGLANHSRENKAIEVRRDIVQIMMGVILLLLFYYLDVFTAAYSILILIFAGYISGGLLLGRKHNILYKALSTLERPDALFGIGAIYLAIGTAIIVGFVHDAHFIMIGIAALFIADSLATIVGKNFDGIKLFYNKRKTVSGTIAFFAAVALIGYPLVGYYSIMFGALLALLESVDSRLDDNFTIALAMVSLYAVYLIM